MRAAAPSRATPNAAAAPAVVYAPQRSTSAAASRWRAGAAALGSASPAGSPDSAVQHVQLFGRQRSVRATAGEDHRQPGSTSAPSTVPHSHAQRLAAGPLPNVQPEPQHGTTARSSGFFTSVGLQGVRETSPARCWTPACEVPSVCVPSCSGLLRPWYRKDRLSVAFMLEVIARAVLVITQQGSRCGGAAVGAPSHD